MIENKAINETATIQFGNEGDTSGFRIVEGEIIVSQERFMKVFLVRDGNTFGVATKSPKNIDAQYYCTNAMTLGREFMGRKFTEDDIAKHLGFPVKFIKVPETN